MKRSKFSLSHYKLQTQEMGKIVPIMCMEVLPGDTIQQATTALVRCSPLVAPVMHPVHVKIHHWFVPNRLIWDEWEDFITGGADMLQRPEHPYFESGTGWLNGTLFDYLGYGTNAASKRGSALPIRAYNLIYNEFYRDQDLCPERVIEKTSGVDNTTTKTLAFAAWNKDYFTTARPAPQKGPDISIPVKGFGLSNLIATGPLQLGEQQSGGTARNMTKVAAAMDVPGHPVQGSTFYKGGIAANVYEAMGTINQLREAFALQRYAEARSLYGSRYTEYLRYLGISSSDARLQRPEYLGGGKSTIQFSEVLQTGPNDPDAANGPQIVGGLYGHGIGATRSNRYRRFFEEHGFIISVMIVRPLAIYSQGQHKMFNKPTREDYFQRELQHIGQQEIFNREIYLQATDATAVFGWQDRYDEYRRMYSTTAGEFNQSPLNSWHFAREFTADPVLNQSFIEGPPTLRPFADQVADPLLCMISHNIQARRLVAGKAGHHVF